MSNEQKNQLLHTEILEYLHTAGAGYDVLRYLSLPELLGSEAPTLLYFMGRKLARQFDLRTMDDLYMTFDKMGWGKLEIIKEKRKELLFSLMSDAIVHRLKAPFPVDFRMEAGFLAEGIEMIYDSGTECVESINSKIHQVQFSIFYTD